MLKHEMIIYHS